MKRLETVALIAAVVIASTLASSCNVRQEMDLRLDGSGRLAVTVRIGEGLREYLSDMSAEARELGMELDQAVFDLDGLREGVAAFPGVRLVEVSVPDPRRLEMVLEFEDIREVAPQPGAGHTPLFRYAAADGRRRLVLHLDRRNYALIRPLIPGSGNPLFEILGPQVEQPYTEDEYREVLRFMIGEEAPSWLEGSALELLVRVPGRVTSQNGGRVVPEGVLFRVPLLEVLLLSEPLVYSLEYVPARS